MHLKITARLFLLIQQISLGITMLQLSLSLSIIIDFFSMDYFSVAELQKFVQESSSFVFYGFEHFLAHLPPQVIAPLCLTGMNIIMNICMLTD